MGTVVLLGTSRMRMVWWFTMTVELVLANSNEKSRMGGHLDTVIKLP